MAYDVVDAKTAAADNALVAHHHHHHHHHKQLVLSRQSMPRFWRPNDPVLLLSGDGVERSFVHGADGRFAADGTLVCRITGQTVQGIATTPPGGASPTVTVAPAPSAGAAANALAHASARATSTTMGCGRRMVHGSA